MGEIPLEPEQTQLLESLVEAYRRTPRDQRHEFIYVRAHDGDSILHDGFGPRHELRAFVGDIDALVDAGLIRVISRRPRGEMSFVISPVALRYYEGARLSSGTPVQRVENTVRSYLGGEEFRRRCRAAYDKWAEAERLLWATESEKQLTAIGHLCREAIQAFATTLVDRHQPAGVPSDPTKTVARVQAVLQQHRTDLGDHTAEFLKALLAYWGTVADLVQRQEHGAQKEGEPLQWEDARRVVFHTALVMYEVDHAVG